MKLIANSSYGYQIMDRNRHTVTKYLTDEKTHRALNIKMFKRLNQIIDQRYEVELVKSKIEHWEPIIGGFFILQYAKLRMLQLYYSFLKKFCDTDKYEELEMDTDSLYLALSKENVEDVILPEKRAEWDQLRSKDCPDNFTANASDIFSPKRAIMPTRSMIRESRVFSKKSLDVQKCCVSVAKHIAVLINRLTSTSLETKDSIKDNWKTVAMVDQCENIAKCWRSLLM